jgi:hypothetical protein
MTDTEVKTFLKENGYPEHLVAAGKKGLIEQWEKFVAAVEGGYSLTLEDYRNDLDLRAILSRLGLQAEIEEADSRFRRLLVFTGVSVWDCDDNPDAFWLFGYPRNAKGDLLADLRNEGFED